MIPSNLPTTWNPPTGKARWAQSIVTLVDYLRPRYPTLTFLGGIGDQTHVSEGNMSAHNPITRAPDGFNLVLAVDLGVTDGNYAPLLEIRQAIYAHPGDPRMAGEGYMSGPDDQANNWPLGTGWNSGNGDAGHLHINVAAKYFPFQPGGYLPSMDLTTPWDFMEDDMFSDADRQALTDVRNSLINGGLTSPGTFFAGVNGKIDVISSTVTSIAAKVGSLTGGDVDEAALATQLAADLNATLPAAVIAALKEAL